MMRQGMERLGVVVGLMVAVGAWIPSMAQAVPVTYEFSGTVDSVDLGLSGAAAVGDVFSGSFTYETDTPLSYQDLSTNYFVYFGAISNVNYTVGNSSGFGPVVDQAQPYVAITNDPQGGDQFRIEQIVAGPSVDGPLSFEFSPYLFSLVLHDPSGSMFSSGALPTTLMLPEFSRVRALYRFDLPMGGTGFSNITSSVTSLTRVNAVPEPSSLLLLGSGLAGLVLWRRRLGA